MNTNVTLLIHASSTAFHLRRYLHGSIQRSNRSKEPIIWTSNSLDPYLNLSLEEYLFRKVHVNSPILFVYRNRKSIIIGRNQNPWQESDLNQLDLHGISLVRRRSGGGTVYHDEGNTNYSIMLPRDQFERKTNTSIVAKSVKQMGIDSVSVTDRYDVCVGDKKVSGSAFRITTSRAYHHGTMLIDSNLERLRGSLRPTPNIKIIDSKAVSSVRSPVTRLVQNQTSLINHQQFTIHLVKNFLDVYYPHLDYLPDSNVLDQSELDSNSFVNDGYHELKSWDWIFGQTPEFTRLAEIQINHEKQSLQVPVEITYKHAKIKTTRVLLNSLQPIDRLNDWKVDNYINANLELRIHQKVLQLFPIGASIKVS